MNQKKFDSMLRGLVLNTAQEMDVKVSDSLRNRLFAHGPYVCLAVMLHRSILHTRATTDCLCCAVGRVGLDLSALDLERGRDHGLTNYMAMREALGLSPTPSVPSGLLQRMSEMRYDFSNTFDVFVLLLWSQRHNCLLYLQRWP
jgi:hypothetical protein